MKFFLFLFIKVQNTNGRDVFYIHQESNYCDELVSEFNEEKEENKEEFAKISKVAEATIFESSIEVIFMNKILIFFYLNFFKYF